MFYEYDLTIPAGTLEADPAEVEAIMSAGIITQVEVQIPFGCRGLVFTAAKRGLHQVWPSNPDGSIKGNGDPVTWGEDYDLTETPHSLILQGWSPDTSFAHVITWRFQIKAAPVKESKPPKKKSSIFGGLNNKGAS